MWKNLFNSPIMCLRPIIIVTIISNAEKAVAAIDGHFKPISRIYAAQMGIQPKMQSTNILIIFLRASLK